MEAAAVQQQGTVAFGLVPTRMLSDERLGRMATAGDRRAFTAIHDRYHQRLYRYCRSLLRNDDDARDALQSTMLRALSSLWPGRGHGDARLTSGHPGWRPSGRGTAASRRRAVIFRAPQIAGNKDPAIPLCTRRQSPLKRQTRREAGAQNQGPSIEGGPVAKEARDEDE